MILNIINKLHYTINYNYSNSKVSRLMVHRTKYLMPCSLLSCLNKVVQEMENMFNLWYIYK